MKKTIIALLISFVIALSCIHCSGSILNIFSNSISSTSSTLSKNQDGDIFEEVILNIDSNTLNANINFLQLKMRISQQLQHDYNEYIYTINTKLQELTYSKDKELRDRYEQLLEEAKLYEPVLEGNSLICKTEFKSSTAYCIFYNITETLFENYKKVKGTFINKYYYSTTTDVALNQGLYQQIMNIVENDITINLTESTNKFSYLARSKRYHSNADEINKTSDGYYLHTWDITDENQEIYFYLKIANRATWFAVAIIISLILSIILILIGIIITLIKKHKNKSLIK